MNCLILLADGFETVEALQTYDLLKRTHKFDVRLCSIKSTLEVVSSQSVKVTAELLLSNVDPLSFDFLILPGGRISPVLSYTALDISGVMTPKFLSPSFFTTYSSGEASLSGLPDSV